MAASTMAPQWEVVGKNVKKSKRSNQKSGKMTKSQIKNFIENMPKVRDLAPVKESPTIFDAFLQKEASSSKQGDSNNVSSSSSSGSSDGRAGPKQNASSKSNAGSLINNTNEPTSKKNQAKKKGQQEKRKEMQEKPKHTLEDALAAIQVDDLHSFVSLVQERFPEAPLVWLKDLTSYLNLKLNVTLTDPLFSGKPVDYPLSVIPTSIHQIILDVFELCPDTVLQLYFELLITNFVEDMVKGLDTNGYRIMIQCLAFCKPSLTLNNLQKYKDLRGQHQNRHSVCLSLLWALGQGGIKDLGCGLKVWLEMMLPVLGMRAYSKYTIDYLDVLFSKHSNVESCGRILDIREFFPVMDLIFSHGANLPPVLHKQLLGLYPKLKTVAFGQHPEQVLRNYFPSFLLRLNPDCPLLLQNELKTCLITCLATDIHCYSVWRQLYTKHLVQSSLLLQHLLDEWDSVGAGMPKKLLYETLRTFCVTNEELESSGKSQPKGFQECIITCEALSKKMSVSTMFPWRLLMVFLFVVVAGLFAYDLSLSGSFEHSKTGQVLNDLGVIAVCEHAWIRIRIYSLKLYRWSEDNFPIYFSAFCDFCHPYIHMFWSQLYLLGVCVVDQTQGIRNYLNAKIPEYLEWLNENVPELVQRTNTWDVWPRVQNSMLFVWSPISNYVSLGWTWLQENVFVGKLSSASLQRCATDTAETLQRYTIAVYEWMMQQMSALITAAAGE